MIHVNGLDVSDWQRQVDWKKVKADGYSFAYTKATQGVSSVQGTFAANYTGIAAAGMLRGATTCSSSDGILQSKRRCSYIPQLLKPETCPQ